MIPNTIAKIISTIFGHIDIAGLLKDEADAAVIKGILAEAFIAGRATGEDSAQPKWRPIETCKIGDMVLLLKLYEDDSSTITIGFYHGVTDTKHYKFTHWMPLPKALVGGKND